LIVVDSSAIIAYMNSADGHHAEVSDWLQAEGDDLATTPLIIAEADHLAGAHGGASAAQALRSDLVAGAYLVEWWPEALGASVRVAERYADTGLGLADASLMVLAQRLNTVAIATLDERHFRAVRPLAGGKAFRLLPRDR
jgi:predicted nucleic acid-binding protein